MNKIFLLILLSSFILIGMDKNQVLEPDVSINISFSPQALEKLALEALNPINPIQ